MINRTIMTLTPFNLELLIRAVGNLFTAAGGAGFLDGFLDRFTGFAGALLNPTEQFVMLALDVLEIVIRELGPLLFQLAFGDVPVAFDFECVHSSSFCSSFPFAVNMTAKVFSRFGRWLKLRPGLALYYGVQPYRQCWEALPCVLKRYKPVQLAAKQ
jgi:hypothetical protein